MHWQAVLQAGVGIVLIAAALTKTTGGSSVRPFLNALGVAPQLGRFLNGALPIAEGACGVGLLLSISPWAAAGAVVLSAGFAVALVTALRGGVTVGCRCFGSLDRGQTTSVTAARAITLALAALVLLGVQLDNPASGRLDPQQPLELTATLGMGVLAAAVYLTTFSLLARVQGFERDRARVQGQIRAQRTAEGKLE
ncbi:MAG: MauE/DoxX family redox-associated membrane protein [Micromonosporaceae bacterium]